jgi:hypothetical protein
MSFLMVLGIFLGFPACYSAWLYWDWYRSRRHMNHVLSDVTLVGQLLEEDGLRDLLDEAGTFHLRRGSWVREIKEVFRIAKADGRTDAIYHAIGALFFTVLSCVGGWYIGLLTLMVCVAPAALKVRDKDLVRSQKYIRKLFILVFAWNREDPDGCLSYCLEDSSSLRQVHSYVCESKGIKKRFC